MAGRVGQHIGANFHDDRIGPANVPMVDDPGTNFCDGGSPYYGSYYPYNYGYGYGYPGYGYGYPSGYNYGSYTYNNYGYGHGGVVIAVQSRLARMGYYRGPIDGIMGPETSFAIRAYERDHGLRMDGSINGPLMRSMGIRY